MLAIPEDMVLAEPDVIRSTVSLWRIYGWHVVCVTHSHRTEAQAVLGDRVEYVASDAWLDHAVWVGRR